MEILELKVFGVPNIYSLREPMVRIQVKLEELADIPTKDMGDLNDSIIKLFPGIWEHKCAKGYVGGFVERLREGTYLAHVIEHLCLETQKMIGYDVKYGKARQLKEDIYHVIYACEETNIGKKCGIFVISTLNQLMKGEQVDMQENIDQLKKLCVKYDIGVSTGAIINEAKRRGIPVGIVNQGELVRLGYGKYQKCISATLYEDTKSISVDMACNKQLTKLLLEEVSIPVPKGKEVLDIEEAMLEANAIGYPIVLKPKNGNKGQFVFTNIHHEDALRAAFLQAVTFDGEVIIEKYIEGKDYRILVVNGQVVAAAQKIPAHVVGDGQHCVEELIEIENQNALRGEDHEKPLTKIKLDKHVKAMLEKQGISLSHIPKQNQVVWLRETANLSTGGQAYDCTDLIHPENKDICEAAAKTIGLDIAGIDIVTPDISKPMRPDHGAIIEVNAAPGIRMHLSPTRGVSRDVASKILDMIFPLTKPFTIPIVAITGTNGKTTTTRMISSILRRQGLTVGTTTTQGIYIGHRCIEQGDTTGPKSAKRILNHREVDIAVLETARGGIIRDGLAYEKADIAVFTNLTEDHIGVDGVHTMEELLHVKSLVIEAVKEDGACLLNADDPWVMKAREKAKGNKVLFSMSDKNPIIIEHIQHGGTAIYQRDHRIYIVSKGSVRRSIDISDIPSTLDGRLKHNIYNSMAAIGACFALGIPWKVIKEALREFTCDADVNPGRFNIYDMKGLKVILDYAHNVDGYRATIEGLRSLKPSRLVGIIGIPGDRLNTSIEHVGKICGAAFDYIFIKEDQDLRGRKELEVAQLLYQGALSGGIPNEHIEIIPDEKEAFLKALQQAHKEDVIVVFFEKMEPLIELLEGFKTQDLYLNLSERRIFV